MLQSSTWGWLKPRNSPVTIAGFSLTPYVIIGGLVLLALFRTWERHREARGDDLAMAVLGAGMGLLASQLGNVVQSSVGEADRSEAGGLQYTAQQLGSALGTALIGAILIGALAAAFSSKIASNPDISADVRQQVGVRLEAGIPLGSTSQLRAGPQQAPVPPAGAKALTDAYAQAQLQGLKTGILTAGAITLASFWLTRRLPARTGGEVLAEAGGGRGG